MTTLAEAMRKVTGILQHPAFQNRCHDVVIQPGPNRTVLVSGPRTYLDGFSRALENSGMVLSRPAPAMLVVVF